jgi:hypothetical protein
MNNSNQSLPKGPDRPDPGLLDVVIILFASAAVFVFLVWLATVLAGNTALAHLPPWVESAFSSIWTAVTGTALGIGAAVVRAFRDNHTPHPNYLLWILVTVVVMLLLVWLLMKMISPAPNSQPSLPAANSQPSLPVASPISVASSPALAAPTPVSSRQLLGTFNRDAEGCQDTATPYSATATGRLDTAHGGSGGAPAGFDFEPNGNGNHGIRDASASGNTVKFVLHAEGGGSRGAFNACNGASGANSSVTVYAWVFPS